MSLWQLVLCRAAFLTTLVHKSTKALQIDISTARLWTDSTIVVAWLAAPGTSQKVYVAISVAKIQQYAEILTWKHASSEDHPADITSRWMMPQDFKDVSCDVMDAWTSSFMASYHHCRSYGHPGIMNDNCKRTCTSRWWHQWSLLII